MPNEEGFTHEDVENAGQEGYEEGYESATVDANERYDQWRSDAKDVLDEAIDIAKDASSEIKRLKLPD